MSLLSRNVTLRGDLLEHRIEGTPTGPKTTTRIKFEVVDWLKKNTDCHNPDIVYDSVQVITWILFDTEEEAVNFKLTWF